jgi:dephospho-CoA kinase
MIVIGLAGYAGSGKTTVANYLKKKYGFEIYTFSNVIEKEAIKMGLLKETHSMEEKKKILSDVGGIIREKYGRNDIFAEMIINEILEKNPQRVCVDGFRSIEEVNAFRKRFEKFLLLFLRADPKKRYERRKFQDKNMKLSLNEFLKRDEQDKRLIGMDKILEMADIVIDNNNGVDVLYKRIDEILKDFIE